MSMIDLLLFFLGTTALIYALAYLIPLFWDRIASRNELEESDDEIVTDEATMDQKEMDAVLERAIALRKSMIGVPDGQRA